MEALSQKPRSRRNLPSLGELHITPLTRESLASSPLAEDDAEDPLSSDRPRSYLATRSLPQTPSILSRSSSRTRVRSRSRGHRRNKSLLTLTSLDDGSLGLGSAGHAAVVGHDGPYTPGPYGPDGDMRRPKSAAPSGRLTPGRVRVVDRDRTDFLLRTASLLVESASESKGQGWINKRNSTTSLVAAGNWDEARILERISDRDRESAWAADDEYSPVWSRADANSSAAGGYVGVLGGSRKGSRRGSMSGPSSRWQSRRNSKAGLQSGFRTPGGASTPRSGYFDSMSLEFADEQEWDAESSEEEIDESELRRLVRRRVGGFFEDIFGGWLDFRGDDDEDEHEADHGDEDDEDGEGNNNINDNEKSHDTTGPDRQQTQQQSSSSAAARKAREAELARRRKIKFAGVRKQDIVKVQPPADAGGLWSDVGWFAGLATRALV